MTHERKSNILTGGVTAFASLCIAVLVYALRVANVAGATTTEVAAMKTACTQFDTRLRVVEQGQAAIMKGLDNIEKRLDRIENRLNRRTDDGSGPAVTARLPGA